MTEEANTDFDYSEHLPEEDTAEGGDLAKLHAFALKQVQALAEVAACEAKLASAKEKYKDIAERQLPEEMEKCKMKTFTTRSGLIITIENTVRASIPKHMKEKAFAWLRARSFAALIKRKVTAEFGKGEDARAEALAKALAKKYPLVSDESEVHHSTLSAWANRELAKGTEIPFDIFGIYEQKAAKVTLPSKG